ncbi:MAG: hypothetical protein Q9199_004080 [Rusavskia elegans]
MSLPSEVKNMIYNYALTSECEIPLVSRSKGYRHTIGLGDTDSFQSFRRRAYHAWDGAYIPRRDATIPIIRPSFAPTIIALNREIHAQAQPILYGANAFALEDPKALLAFCANIGPKNCAYLQEVSLKHWGNTVVRRAMCHPAFAMLASAVNLKCLNLDCCIYWGAGSGTARQFFRDGHNWLEAVGTKEGRRDAAVDLIQLGMQHIARPRVGVMSTDHTTDEEKLEKMTDAFQAELRRLLKA